MSRIPARYGDYIYGSIQAAITTAVAITIATIQSSAGCSLLWVGKTWLFSWLTMLPVVIFIAPFIRRAVMALTDQSSASRITAR